MSLTADTWNGELACALLQSGGNTCENVFDVTQQQGCVVATFGTATQAIGTKCRARSAEMVDTHLSVSHSSTVVTGLYHTGSQLAIEPQGKQGCDASLRYYNELMLALL